MTNSTAQWEQAVLNKLTSNGERIAVVENRLDRIEEDLSELKQNVSDVETEFSGINQRLSVIEKFMEKIDYNPWFAEVDWWRNSHDRAVPASLIALSLIANFMYSLFAEELAIANYN